MKQKNYILKWLFIYVVLITCFAKITYGKEFLPYEGNSPTNSITTNEVDWANLQYPASGTISATQTYSVYAQVYEAGVTNPVGQGVGISAWIGYSTANTDPATWTDWLPATFNVDVGNNDEYTVTFSGLPSGTYYYASRFQIVGNSTFKYGGYNAGGGGFWDGTNNVSGVLTVDASNPTITSTTPVNNATGVAVNQNLIIVFNENIQKNTGNIVIKEVQNGNIFQTINVTNSAVSVTNNLVEVAHNILGFNTNYYIEIEEESFVDAVGNPFAGITGTTLWNFTTELNTVSVDWANLQYPASGSITSSETYDVYAHVFDDIITPPAGQGAGIVAWIGYSTTNTNPETWTDWLSAIYNTDAGNNDEYFATLSGLDEGIYYYASRFQIVGSSTYRYGGYNAAGGGFWDGNLNVSGVLTVDDLNPTITSTIPTDNATGIAVNQNLIVVFSENVQKGIGNILIKETSGGNIFQTIDVEADAVTVTNNSVEIIHNNFASNTEYYVEMEAGSFEDLVGNPFEGISGANSWNFTTETSTLAVDWANLQFPATAIINTTATIEIYAQVYAQNITPVTGQGAGIEAWIGYSTTNTNPATWTNWVEATFNVDAGNNDEYVASLSALPQGTYYFASRFQITGSSVFKYGGYNAAGGGFWDGTNNVSGVLTVDGIRPFATTVTPAPNEIDVSVNQNLIVVFSENVVKGSGNLLIKDFTTGNIFQSIDVDSENVTITNNTATITHNTFAYNAHYFVEIPEGIVEDLAGNKINAIMGNETWAFTTEIEIPSIDWCNLQSPQNAEIETDESVSIYAQIYEENLTNETGQAEGITAWIGYSTTNSNPETWTNWIEATFNVDAANNDEYVATISELPIGIYYYASRFQLAESAEYKYGGYNVAGGGFWDGTNNVSGVLTVVQDTKIESINKNEIVLFPNPANNQITLSNVENSTIYIYNFAGQLIFQTESPNAITTIQLSTFAGGTYFVKVVKLNNTITQKFTIVR